MTVEEFSDSLLVEIGKRSRRRIQTPLSWGTLAELIRAALDPQPEEPDAVPFYRAPVFAAEFPKLKVRYDANGTSLEWLIVDDGNAEAPFHAGGWLTREMSELAMLESTGVPRRPLHEHAWREEEE